MASWVLAILEGLFVLVIVLYTLIFRFMRALVEHQPMLSRLYLSGNELTDVDVSVLRHCPNISMLSISDCQQLSDVGLDHIKVRRMFWTENYSIYSFFSKCPPSFICIYRAVLRLRNVDSARMDCVR